MNPSAIFIKRPIATSLMALAIFLSGIIAFGLLPVSALPQIDFPTILVQASLPGASPDIMATSVVTPLERQLGRIAGVTQIISSSNLGSTNIAVEFDLARNIDGAAGDVQAAINAARGQLPTNLPNNPTYRKINPADSAILVFTLTSDYFDKAKMYDVASTIIAQRISQVAGVGQVYVGGGALPAVRVELNPFVLNKYGIGLEDVRATLAEQNVNHPKGQVVIGKETAKIVANDQLYSAEEYRPLIVVYRNSAPVRISDIGSVVDFNENIRTSGYADGKPAIVIVVYKQPGVNVIETVDRIKAALPEIRASIPRAMDMQTVVDRTATIRTSLFDVELTLLVAILLVILAAYLFLAEVRAALVASVAVPLSLLGTFAIMYLVGYSLDNLSLMALTIATGFVVDDAVVVLENTTRHVEAGIAPVQAALVGAKEVSFTVLAMSLSLIAVFIPILFMGGLVGRLFREFAVTLSSAILVSLFVSLTITPMMCAQLLKKRDDVDKAFVKKQHVLYEKLFNAYKGGLHWSLKHAWTMLTITLSALVLSVILFIYVPKGFFPQQDTRRILGVIQAQQDISFQSLQKKMREFMDIISTDPAVLHVVGFIGSSNVTNSGNVYVALKPLSQTHLAIDDIINRLRKKVANVSGAAFYMQPLQDLVIGVRLGNAQYQYTISADSLELLNTWVPRIMPQFAKLPEVSDVNNDQLNGGLQTYVTYDRDTASRLGLNVQLIDNTLYDAFGQRQVSTIYRSMNQYHVVMEVAPEYWQNPEILKQIYVRSTTGAEVPLSVFSRFDLSATLLQVNHQNQFPAATISFNLHKGVALGQVVKKINMLVANMHLPAGITGTFQGTAQAFEKTKASEMALILLALLTVYIVLGILYESLIHPITILSTLPTAGVGALLALLVTRTDLSIVSLIGMILLVGIVKKNAIMMIDFAEVARHTDKKPALDAIYQAALLRFRPIMITTTAATFGALPLLLGIGLGSELRRPLGIVIVGGLLVSQMLTLFTVPVIYLMLDRLGFRGRNLWQRIFFRVGRLHAKY